MTRKQALDTIRYAGYHGDYDTYIRTYVDNRISYAKANEAFKKGIAAKSNGLKCTCSQCQPS